MTRRLLLVEPSATMRHVLEKHVRALGHEVEATDSYASASEALQRQFQAFEADFAGVLFGWPSLPDPNADALAACLESDDFADLPVVVMSTDMRAETRAWVAGRERTAVLAWKDYLGVDALLERFLDEAEDGAGERVAKFDNADIAVRDVDDTQSIRYSLRELFELHGYRVGLAATREEALAAARETRFDIAVLDFYLEETTGDALCRDLVADPACGDIVCAVLTGTYADHVIKRSLRAGAVECMFKNESSELLLTRIDAIGRFVRQRRELAVGLGRLERVVETLAGAVVVVDAEGRVRHATRPALETLGLTALDAVKGQFAHALFGAGTLPAEEGRPTGMTWRDATGRPVPLSVTRLSLGESGESLLGFERRASARTFTEAIAAGAAGAGPDGTARSAPGRGDPDAAAPAGAGADAGTPSLVPAAAVDRAVDAPLATEAAPPVGPEGIASRLGLDESAVPFLRELERHVAAGGDRVSLLALGLHERDADGTHTPVAAARVPEIEAGLRRLYRREHHVAALEGHRFGLLIHHSDAPQSYLLTRRLMQLCNELLLEAGGPRLAGTACLIGLANHPGHMPETLLEHALRGVEIVDGRGVDQALLLDLKRMLAVYPASASGSPVPASPRSTAREPGA